MSMLATHLTCPHCSRPLRLSKAPVPGRTIRCPGCTRSFAAGPEVVAGAPAPAPAAEPSAVGPVDPSPRRGLLLAVVVGALVLLVGTTILAVRLAARSDNKQDARASVDSDGSPVSTATEPGPASADGAATAAGTPETDRSDDPGRAPPTLELPAEPPPANIAVGNQRRLAARNLPREPGVLSDAPRGFLAACPERNTPAGTG